MKDKNDKIKHMNVQEKKTQDKDCKDENEDMNKSVNAESEKSIKNESIENMESEDQQEECQCQEAQAATSDAESKENDTQTKLEVKTKQCEEYFDKLQRLAAEFDNYKKRTQKEKETIYEDALADVVLAFIPVMDNFERALKTISGEDEQSKSIKDGIDMVFKQMQEAFKKIGVAEIISLGGKFDPHHHNALMHVEDEAFGENEVVDELMKGYIYKEKVIRHSGVKVAN